ncbi:MAG: tetratricopeptide repeat protein [Verrucomicrobiota bacterium]
MREFGVSVLQRRSGIVLFLAFCTAALSAWSAPYVITVQGQRVEGTAIRATSEGEIILTMPQGQRSFFKGQYLKAVADRPPELDRAAQLVQNKQFDEAVKLLEDVGRRYVYLDWDIQAQALLPQVYVRKGDMNAAVMSYEKLFTTSAKSKDDPAIQWAYRQTLLDAKQYTKLEPLLDTVIAGGDRAEAARAQIMRGDVKAAQNQLEGAALDYLRTVVLFANEKASQPEALFKAADTLERLRDARAKELYKKLVDEYPSSPQAVQAKGKI